MGRLIGGSKFDIGIAVKRRQMEQNFVLTGIDWEVVGGLPIGETHDPLTLPKLPKPPKLGGPENSSFELRPNGGREAYSVCEKSNMNVGTRFPLAPFSTP